MSFAEFLSDVLDSVFAPPCATDSCSSGYIGDGFLNSAGSEIGSCATSQMQHNDPDWTSAFGTQSEFQPSAESGSMQFGGTFDAFDSSSSGMSSGFDIG